jgi:hypothetical protein
MVAAVGLELVCRRVPSDRSIRPHLGRRSAVEGPGAWGETTEQARRVVLDRQRRELILLAAWQDARAGLAGIVAKRDRLAGGIERAVCAVLGMTRREVLGAERHARTG